MPAPLSKDIRDRFALLIERGYSGRAAARQLCLSPSTDTRYIRAIREGRGLEPAPAGGRLGTGKVARHRALFEELLAQDPDMTLREMTAALMEAEGVFCCVTSLSRGLRALGFNFFAGADVPCVGWTNRLGTRFKKRRWLPPSAISQG